MTEAERIDRFEQAYNRIDHALNDMIGSERNPRKHHVAAKVRIAANRRRRMARYADFLLEIGELRNAVVHNRTGDEYFIAVPSQQTVEELERIEQQMFSPERVVPRFQREVRTLAPDDSVAHVLSLIQDDGYSRYPVYSREGFVGLLTPNGVARWIASHMKGNRLEVDVAAAPVSDVLAADHRREAVAFVSRDAFIDDVEEQFREQRPLEAVIITEHGKVHQQPIGLIGPGDLAGGRA